MITALHLVLLGWWRDRRLRLLLLSCLIALIVAAAYAVQTANSQTQAFQKAAQEARQQWLARGDQNPHSMAHFGDFLFRPPSALIALDPGIQARLGSVIYIEGHTQNVPQFAPITQNGTLSRFPALHPAFLLQTLVPLLMMIIGGTAIMADKSEERIQFCLALGTSTTSWVLGYFTAIFLLGGVCLLVVLLTTLTSYAMLSSSNTFPLSGTLWFFGLYCLFLAVIAAVTTIVAVICRRAQKALMTLLAIWLSATFILPQMSASIIAFYIPLPDQYSFNAQMQQDRQAGPDGHQPEHELVEAKKQAILAEYGVSKVEDLPFNFDGLVMQLDETFGNQVWDKHFGDLSLRFRQQVWLSSLSALLNPFQALHGLSMALAGSELVHDIAFQQQAEIHRRTWVEQLNHEHAYGGSRTGDWDWQANAQFYQNMKTFRFQPPPISALLDVYWPALLALLGWLLLTLWLMTATSARLAIGDRE